MRNSVWLGEGIGRYGFLFPILFSMTQGFIWFTNCQQNVFFQSMFGAKLAETYNRYINRNKGVTIDEAAGTQVLVNERGI